jgi:hypothetical protein
VSGQATTWAFSQPVEPHRGYTLVAIAHCHNHNTGQCNPSLRVLAAMTKKSVRTVREDVAWLESNGYLRRQFRFHRQGGQASTFYVLPLGPRRHTAGREGGPPPPFELELEQESELKHADLAVCAGEGHEVMDAYEDIWGSSAERDAQRRAEETREAKERTARARKAALAARPRSQWRPGHLEDFFRAQVVQLSLPRVPQFDRVAMRGAFQALLANGHKPEDLAAAIEAFCEDRSLWGDLVEVQGAPIWKVFLKLSPTLATRAGRRAEPAVSQNRLPGWDW